jgi:hypothetical protein
VLDVEVTKNKFWCPGTPSEVTLPLPAVELLLKWWILGGMNKNSVSVSQGLVVVMVSSSSLAAESGGDSLVG